MNRIVLICSNESLRYYYFNKAAKSLNIEIENVSYGEIDNFDFSNSFVKVEPLVYSSSDISELAVSIQNYIQKLNELSQLKNVKFLNPIDSIIDCLDKLKCKQILQTNHIKTTPLLSANCENYVHLKELMFQSKTKQVFVKQNYGSGAAGIIAYRFDYLNNKESAFCGIQLSGNALHNSRKIAKLSNTNDISQIINEILKQGAIVEKWIAKANFQNQVFDIRVVAQFGKVEYKVARQSDSPITNLHLNNKALSFDELGLPVAISDKIDKLAIDVMNCFSGLNYAGIDILLENGTLEPYVIEVNAQGDEIYMDMMAENTIYKNQLKYMKTRQE